MVDIQQFLFMDKLNQEMIILMELPVIIPMEDAHAYWYGNYVAYV
jgi:hypothetical protein